MSLLFWMKVVFSRQSVCNFSFFVYSISRGIRQQFVDSFLTTCKVEIFSPGEELLTRGSIATDLFLLVSGTVKLLPWEANSKTVPENEDGTYHGTSIADSDYPEGGGSDAVRIITPGEFINEIGFFTESPEIDTAKTMSICKILSMSKVDYKRISEDHPGSVAKILNNLLQKAEELAGAHPSYPARLEAGYSDFADSSFHSEVRSATVKVQAQAAVTAVKDLVVQHMNKLKDDHTTRFLFAASRGDVAVISRMCDLGFDPNNADYDNRTGLMVASMKGNTDAVKILLDYGASPNMVDMHGTSALAEATRGGHEDTMTLLLSHGAELSLDAGEAAGKLCKMVFDGDMLHLRRLLIAKIQVDAGDYDMRTASHIAAAEGNVAALRLLVEFGADLMRKDRWGNTIFDEARRQDKNAVLEFLDDMKANK
jgi:ankyrin repeat protein